jgi:hypothetical protein
MLYEIWDWSLLILRSIPFFFSFGTFVIAFGVYLYIFCGSLSIMFLVLTYHLTYIGEQNIEMDKSSGIILNESRNRISSIT